jgi:hypothetical protein
MTFLIICHALLSVVAAVELLVFHFGQRNGATIISRLVWSSNSESLELLTALLLPRGRVCPPALDLFDGFLVPRAFQSVYRAEPSRAVCSKKKNGACTETKSKP